MDCTVIANKRATNILLFLVTYISRNAPVIQKRPRCITNPSKIPQSNPVKSINIPSLLELSRSVFSKKIRR